MARRQPKNPPTSDAASELSRRAVLKAGSAVTAAVFAGSGIGWMGTANADVPPVARGDHLWVRAGERTGLRLDSQGRVVAVQLTHGLVQVDPSTSGLFVRDPVTGKQAQVLSRVRRSGRELSLHASLPSLAARVDVTYRPIANGTVQVDGAVVDLTGADRVLDTVFVLSLVMTKGVFENNTIGAQLFDSVTQPVPQNNMPVATVTSVSRDFSLGYAIAPNHPCRFEMGVLPGTETTGFSIRQMWGLSPAASGPLKSRAPFAFAVDLGVNPAWSYRSALQRYYDRTPEWFTNPAGQGGYGIEQVVPRSYYPAPQFLAFHTTGRGKDTATSVATTLEEFMANCEVAADQQNGVRTLPYSIPGQREITDLSTLPTSYDEAMAALASYQHAPVIFGASNSPSSYDSVDQLREIMLNCGLFDPDGRYKMELRWTDWGGNSVTFPINPNPRLYAGEGKETIAKYLLDHYIPWMLTDDRVDGMLSDSIFGWGEYWNYRREHFAYATIPLSYTETTSIVGNAYTPGLYNSFSVLEYEWSLRDELHRRGKLLYVNGIRKSASENRAFDAFANDILGVESQVADAIASEGELAFRRTVAYRKPVLMDSGELTPQVWVNGEDQIAKLWKLSLLYGNAPSADCIDGQAFENAGPIESTWRTTPLEIKYDEIYVPILRKLMSAGWEPVTGLTSSNESVRIERFGDKGEFFLVIYNLGSAQDVSFVPDWDVLPPIDQHRVIKLPDGSAASSAIVNAITGRGSLAMVNDEQLVLQIKR